MLQLLINVKFWFIDILNNMINITYFLTFFYIYLHCNVLAYINFFKEKDKRLNNFGFMTENRILSIWGPITMEFGFG